MRRIAAAAARQQRHYGVVEGKRTAAVEFFYVCLCCMLHSTSVIGWLAGMLPAMCVRQSACRVLKVGSCMPKLGEGVHSECCCATGRSDGHLLLFLKRHGSVFIVYSLPGMVTGTSYRVVPTMTISLPTTHVCRLVL